MTRLGTGLTLLVFALFGCSSNEDSEGVAPLTRAAETDTSLSASPSASDQDSDSASGALASCAEEYSPDAVATRAFAFDGVVVRIGPSVSDRGDSANLGLPGVTFEVREWFAGGSEDSVTVDMQLAPDEFRLGSRLLVSGEARWGGGPLEHPIAWSCGFSFAYDAEAASAWRSAVTAA